MILIKFFQEEVDNNILRIKNMKSNLVMNLPLINEDEKKKNYWKIVQLELYIVDIEIQRDQYAKAGRNLLNAIKFLKKIENQNQFQKKIELRGLIEEKFPEDKRKEFGLLLKDHLEEDEENETQIRNNLYSFIIDKIKKNNGIIKMQNLNKSHFYLFQNTPFRYINALALPTPKISSHPIFSEQFDSFFSNSSTEWHYFKKINNRIVPDIKYYDLLNKKEGFTRRINNFEDSLLMLYDEKLNDFSKLNTKQIKEWEKSTMVLDFFTYGSKI
jgi:hypothetical protein